MPVGPRQDEFMNTVVGGPADAPALVMIPGRSGHSNLPCVPAECLLRNTATAASYGKWLTLVQSAILQGTVRVLGSFSGTSQHSPRSSACMPSTCSELACQVRADCCKTHISEGKEA